MPFTDEQLRMLRRQRNVFLAINSVAAFAVGVFICLLIFSVYPKLADQGKRIQEQRRDSIIDGCREQNDRHDHTLIVLRRILIQQIDNAHLATPEGQKLLDKKGTSLTFKQITTTVPKSRQASVSQSVSTTLTLIQALAPKQNCQELANKAVQPPS